MPNQSNRFSVMFDPTMDDVPFALGMEIFEPGHKTPRHVHQSAHELFLIIAGSGIGFCDGKEFPV